MFNFGKQEIIDNRYIMKGELGKGGMGAVYHAYDRLTGEDVALKLVLAPPSELSFASRSGGLNLYLALAQEFKTLASLRHPHIISVLNYGFDEQQRPYFTMDYLDDAQSPARAAWGKGDEGKVQVLIDILQALSYLHRRNLIHRDLKPANVRVHKDIVKVLDFGLSIEKQDVPEKSEKIVGTIEYMPPEMLRGEPPSVKSDLYAVGVIGYELFTGQYLFDAPSIRELAKQIFNKIPDTNAIGAPKIAAVLMRLLAKNADERYNTADEVVEALSNAIGQPVPEETAAIRDSFLQAADLVGRDAETKTLIARLEDAKNGAGAAILIGGESGVGKSRLLDEIRTRALVNGMLVMRGEASSQGRTPYGIWRGVLRRLILSAEVTSEEAGLLSTIIPDIEKLLEIKTKDLNLDPSTTQQRLLSLIEQLFRQQQRPMMMLLEDLHWAGAESITLLNHLLKTISDLPLLIIGSFRDDEAPNLPEKVTAMEVMSLKRLDANNIEALAVAMLGDAGRDSTLLNFLNKETEGNVFFVVEVLRALAEEAGKLSSVSTMKLPTHVFTGGVDKIIQRRLGRVPEDIRPLLEIAAIYGRYLDVRLLKHIMQDVSSSQFDYWLNVAANAAVLDIQDDQWRFSHEKLREGLERQMDTERRIDIHKQLAEGVEQVYLYAPEYTTALAYHYAEAQNTEKAAHYAAIAGEQVLKSGVYDEAVAYLGYALDRAPNNPDPEQVKRQANLTRSMGLAYQGLARNNKATRIFKDALDMYTAVDYKWGIAFVLSDLGHTAYALQDFEESYNNFRESIKVAMSVRAQQVALAGVVGIARLMLAAKKNEWAVELCAFALDHVAADQQTAERAQALLAELKPTLDPATFDKAKTTGQDKRLSEVVEELL